MTRPAEAAARGFDTMGAVRGHLLLTNCLEDELTRPNIELAMKEDRLLWLDLQGTDDEVLILLREVFKIHPLAASAPRRWRLSSCSSCSGGAAGSARGAEPPAREGWREQSRLTLPLGSLVPTGRGVS
jgi:hypothetical protein